jgi:hypothetical protein
MSTISPPPPSRATPSSTIAPSTLKCDTIFLRHKVEGDEIRLEYTPTEQTADVLTKGLVREMHERFSKAMGLRRLG